MKSGLLVIGRALFALVVVLAAGQARGQAPSITSSGSTTFTDSSAGTFTVTTTGSPTPSISIAPVAPTTGLPPGLSFVDNGDGTAPRSGTPAIGTAGPYTYSLTAANGVLPNATQAFTVTVNPTVVGTWTMTKHLNEEGVYWVSTVELHADGTLLDSSFDVTNPGPATGTWSVTSLNIALFYQASQYVFDGLLNPGYTSMFGSISQGTVGTFVADRVAPPCYTLTTGVDPAGGGSVSANPGPNCNATQYTSGTVVHLTATPANGHTFSSWSGDASGSANPVAVTMDADKSVTATFEVVPPTADVWISKALATAGPFLQGQSVAYTLTVGNSGPDEATTVQVTDTPTNLTITNVTGGGCTALPCTMASLAAGADVTITVTATIDAKAPFDNVATAESSVVDPDSANNTDATGNGSSAVGQVVATPSPVNMRVPIFSPGGATTLNLLNDSPLPVGFTILERSVEAAWMRFPIDGPTWNVPAANAFDRTARAVPQHPRPNLPALELAPIATLDFPTGLVYPWGIGFNTMANDMWVHDIADAGGDGFNHRFLTDGTDTGDAIDTSSWIGDWAADLAYDPWNDKLWQINVGNGNCVHEMDPLTKTSTGNSICPSFPVSQRGLAFDPVSDTFFSGSWNDGAILRFDRDGEILETVNAGLDVSGLAYNPGTGHLFVLTNTDAAADLFVLDVNDGYAVVSSFKVAGMGEYDQAGLDADCAGNLYAVNQGTGDVLVLPSGETGFCSYSTVPWLDETPKSGTIAAGATQAVTLDFTTALQWPGLHQARLRVAGTNPFPPSEVPVNFTISFLDVPANHWADAFIHALAGVRVTRGCGEGNFCPDAEVDRAQMAILMVRSMRGPFFAPPAAKGVFADVVISDTDTTADFIEQLYNDGIVAGCGVDGNGQRLYCPDQPVTRAEMAVFIAGGAELPPVDPPTGYFTDVHGTAYSWSEPFVEAIFNAGITAGCGDHLFCPSMTITRAQLAVWLVSAFGFPYVLTTP